MLRRSAPCSSRWVANVWRSACGERCGEPGCVELAPERPADVGRAQRPAADAHEDVVGRRGAQLGTALDEVAAEGAGGSAAERHDPLLAALSGHAHGGLIGIHVARP